MKTIIAMLAAAFMTTSAYAGDLTNGNGCGDVGNFNKLLNDQDFIVLTRGEGPDGKVNEVWLNGKALIMVVAYDKPAGDKPENIKQVCVLAMAKKNVYNGDTVEVLNKSLEKTAPKL